MKRMKKLLGFALGLVLAIQAPAAPQHPSLPAAAVPDGLGVNIHFTDPRPGEMEMLAAGGFRWVRMDFAWGGTERERGKYNFAAYDRLLAALEAHKVRALFILDYSNPLYERDRSVATEEGRQAFARWAAAAVVRFKGHGILWEIWNEPNIAGFWKPQPDVNQYAALALAASKAIHAAAPPGEAIIGPATSTVDLAFLEGCFKAGLLEWWDAVSVHPYRQTAPETAELDYRKLRRLIGQYAPKGKTIPILSAEWGYSAAWKNFDADKQGKMLPRQWLSNLAQGIPLSIWYDWHDDGKDPKEPEHHFGTVAHDYRKGQEPVYEPKPAYRAAKTLTSMLGGYTFTKRIAVGSAQDHALLFGKGQESRLAVWTTDARPHSIRIPCSPGQFEVVRHTGETGPPLTPQGGVLTVAVTDAPQYLIAKQPNAGLAAAPVAHPLRATLSPVRGKLLVVRVENLGDVPFKGTVRLVGVKGAATLSTQKSVGLPVGDAVTTLNFPLTADSGPDFHAGLQIESKGTVMLEVPPVRFRVLSETMLTGCRIVPDGDAKIASAQTVESATAPQPLPGADAQALKVTYQCDDGWKFFRLIPPEGGPRQILGEPKGFGFWVYGTGNSISPRLRVVDETQQCWQPSGETIDWEGWRFVQLELSRSSGHWGGAKDGVIHFPLRWDSLFLLDNVSRKKTEGTIFIAAPVVIY